MTTDILAFFGRFHPLFVHLPIGFLCFAILVEILYRWKKNADILKTLPILWMATAVSAVLSAGSGYFLSQGGDYDEDVLSWHKYGGIGIGPGGRLTKSDLLAHWEREKSLGKARESELFRGALQLSQKRKALIRNMVRSKAEAPHFYVQVDVSTDALREVRDQANREAGDTRARLTYTHLMIKACALALERFPTVNATFRAEENDIALYEAINIGLTERVLKDARHAGVPRAAYFSGLGGARYGIAPRCSNPYFLSKLGGFGSGFGSGLLGHRFGNFRSCRSRVVGLQELLNMSRRLFLGAPPLR